MSGFLRSLLNKVSGSKNKNKHPIAHIEGADTVLVDSSIFCCPVCYNVYSSAPIILQCGHTFCSSCIRNISIRENLTTVVNHEWVFLCPMCREPCSTKRVIKNYLVEDLLERISSYSPEEDRIRVATSTITLVKQRLENKCRELEQLNNRFQNELQEQKKREMRNYIAIAVFIVSYILLSTIYGV